MGIANSHADKPQLHTGASRSSSLGWSRLFLDYPIQNLICVILLPSAAVSKFFVLCTKTFLFKFKHVSWTQQRASTNSIHFCWNSFALFCNSYYYFETYEVGSHIDLLIKHKKSRDSFYLFWLRNCPKIVPKVRVKTIHGSWDKVHQDTFVYEGLKRTKRLSANKNYSKTKHPKRDHCLYDCFVFVVVYGWLFRLVQIY